MKITIETTQTTASVEFQEGDISTVADHIRGLLVATGYHPETAEEAFNSDLVPVWFSEKTDQNSSDDD
tara:strand:- start:812 stop:1015 length:204 start_codon:yes stop_codon:yes gene_type:complete